MTPTTTGFVPPRRAGAEPAGASSGSGAKVRASIRRGTELDIERLAWDTSTSARRWAEVLTDQARGRTDLAVVEVAGDIVATVLVDLTKGRLWNVLVHPDHRRQGMGRTLVEFGEKRLRAAGFTRAELFVRLDNKAARRFYVELGYSQVGIETLTWYGAEVTRARCALLSRALP